MARKVPDEEILAAAADYAESVGIPCFYLSLEGDSHPSPTLCCEACVSSTRCIEAHRFAAYQSERFGGMYLYLCPAQMLYWASPVTAEGMMRGALVSGPVSICEPDEFFLEELVRRLDHAESIAAKLGEIPRVSTRRSRSLARMLRLAALGVSDTDASLLFEEDAHQHQQAHISEYLHGLKTMEGESRSDLAYPIDAERELVKHTSQGNRREAQSVLEHLLGVILYSAGADVEVIKSRVLELVILLSRAAVEGGADVEQIFGINYRYIVHVRSLTTFEELARWTRRITDRFIELVFTFRDLRHSKYILQTVSYLKRTFRDQASVCEVAAAVGLSSSYLSALFRREIGMTLTEYRTMLRMEYAKQKLLTGNDSIGAISMDCGYEDQSYFTKVFRKTTGILPGRYRETGGRIIASGQEIYEGVTHPGQDGAASHRRDRPK